MELIVKGKEINYPRSWSEMTWGQFHKLRAIPKDIRPSEYRLRAVAALTGIPANDWRASTDIQTYSALALSVEYVFSQDWQEALNDAASASFRRVHLGEQVVELPTDPGALPVGLFEDAKVPARDYYLILQDAEKEPETFDEDALFRNIANLFKIYYQYQRDGEYSYEVARDIDIDAVPFVQVVRWKDFFLSILTASLNGITTESSKSDKRPRRSRRGLTRFLKNTVSRIFSTS